MSETRVKRFCAHGFNWIQVSQKLRELLVTQRAATCFDWETCGGGGTKTQEIASLKRTKDKLSTEMLDLIQERAGSDDMRVSLILFMKWGERHTKP